MIKNALVTGVTGFIGGRLARRLLADSWSVHAVVRKQSTIQVPLPPNIKLHIHDGSMENLSAIVKEASPDIVFHLASLYVPEHDQVEIEGLVASNLLFPTKLAEAMTNNGCFHLVNAGTAWQHYQSADYNPVNLYAATKQAYIDVLRYYHDARGMGVVTLKLFDTWGEGDTRRKILQILVDAARSGTRLSMSPGEQTLDLTYVEDVVEAFVLAAQRLLACSQPLFEDFFVSGERFTLRELATLVAEILDSPVLADFGGRPYRDREVMQPLAPCAEQLVPGWSHNYKIRQTLRRLVRL